MLLYTVTYSKHSTNPVNMLLNQGTTETPRPLIHCLSKADGEANISCCFLINRSGTSIHILTLCVDSCVKDIVDT